MTYDLNTPGKDYESVINVIKSLGNWAKIQKSTWYVSSALTCEQAGKRVLAALDRNDSLMVVDASGNNAYWYNVAPVAAEFIKSNWNK